MEEGAPARTIDFTPLTKARITQGEFGDIIKVSRVTVSNWTRGAGIHDQRVNQVVKLLKIIEVATREGDFPLPKGTPRTERLGAIKKVLVKRLRRAT